MNGCSSVLLLCWYLRCCIDCLVSGARLSAAQKLKNDDCLACHADAGLLHADNGKSANLFVDGAKFNQSIHGTMFSCVDCHKDVKSLAHDKPPAKVTCEQCHSDEQKAWSRSMHSKTSSAGKNPAATCADCHGSAHETVTSTEASSPVNHTNIPKTCGRCHGQKFLMDSNGQSAQAFYSYQESVHGRAVENGSQKAAVCTDCHGSHDIMPANEAQSPIYKFNVPNTCGKCHTDVADTFAASIHGQAVARGNMMAPVCTDCHGIHSIKAHGNPNSPVAEQNLSRDTCAPCHEGVRLSQEFGIPGNRVTSYFDSYHGLAAKGGSMVAANCSSCHGVHNILPSSDPRSTINRANLDATCGKCHRGVTQSLRARPFIFNPARAPATVSSVAVRWVRWIYIPLILLVIGAMFLHNAVIWRFKAAARRRMQNPFMTRMSTNQRWQHLVLLSSFIVLVFTGFALKFPDTWFAHTLGMGENLRGIIHRIAGVVLIAAGIYHVFYLAAAREGRRLLYDIAPRPRDVFDAWGTMRYYLGPRRRETKVRPLQLCREGRSTGRWCRHGSHGPHRHHALGQGVGRQPAGALVGRCCDCGPLL